MPLYIVTDAGVPEPGAVAIAQLHAVIAKDANEAASQVAATLDVPAVNLFMIDASTIVGVTVTKEVTLSLTTIELPPIEGPPS